jgi:endonuclease IV
MSEPKTSESILRAVKAYKEKNADKIKEYHKAYYEKNRDKIIAKVKENQNETFKEKNLKLRISNTESKLERLKKELEELKEI